MPAADESADLKLPLYGHLLERRLVVPSARSGYVAIDWFLFIELMADCLARVDIDEAWYLITYPDIGTAIANGAIESVQQHYAHFGYFEHRMPRKIRVDEAWYLEAHPDVKEAIGSQVYASAQEHYDISGYREGRLPYAGFDLFGEDSRHRVRQRNAHPPGILNAVTSQAVTAASGSPGLG